MCGIFGLLSTSEPPEAGGWEPFATSFCDRIGELTAAPPGDADRPALEGELEQLRRDAYGFVGRQGFLAVLTDEALRRRLAAVAQGLGDWVGQLEARAERGGFDSQSEAEWLNRLILTGRDLGWLLERDLLGNLEPVRRLLAVAPGEEPAPEVWAHGWSLNLTFNGIDRLEVRGRDSAGIAVYVFFPDAGAREGFLDQLRHDETLAGGLSERLSLGALVSRAIVRPPSNDSALLFSFKVANEVGEMGENVRALRGAMASDPIFQRALRAPGVAMQALAHTRWASNGVVSIENCHPVDGAVRRPGQAAAESRGTVVAVLNGDIDNFQPLYRRYVLDRGLEVEDGITTDAKIIPVVIDHHLRAGANLEEAFRKAFDEFEGSMAIGLMAADRPGEYLFGQKGSGQGLYCGFTAESLVVASEMYGLVELTQRYVKAEGEGSAAGEVFHLAVAEDGLRAELLTAAGAEAIPDERMRQAEITTRDINRGDFSHFFLKEISESVETVRKTLRGKLERGADGTARFLLGPEVIDPGRLAALRDGRIRRIVAIGQGTAAIAGEGVAVLLARALADAPHPVQVTAMKATELSGHHLRDEMSDTLVVAVSQSGTTTDTNRTVDLVKQRGAWVIGIVNRRNSDLVYKSHGVLYTSDGRDIEMSVASTKAFYAQNVAGQVLALALAEAVGAAPPELLVREAEALVRLPSAMAGTLELGESIRQLAHRYAPRKRYWALVGSGPGKIAADEIRIKLSELCYKSIAVDFTEDKKHIDLSSEPLIVVCASGVPAANVSDVVKEVAIFKAHQSVPVVITDEGEERYDPYAAGVVRLPAYDGAVSYLLTTMAGHLFGYHAASYFDAQAARLRRIRTGVLEQLRRRRERDGGLARLELPELSDALIEQVREFHDLLLDGVLDSGLAPATSVRLALLFQVILSRAPMETSLRGLVEADTPAGVLESLLATLSAAINELTRPIDAIKHQAKTVTVGISRAEAPTEGVLWSVVHQLDLPVERIPASQRTFLTAFEPLVAAVAGTTLYRLEDLDSVGRPRKESTLRVVEKTGCAADLRSRADEGALLTGTKWAVAKSREVYLGYGQTDGRKILIVPVIGEERQGYLLLYHLDLLPQSSPEERMEALRALRSRYENLRVAVTERLQVWDPSHLDLADNEALFFGQPSKVAEEIAVQRTMS